MSPNEEQEPSPGSRKRRASVSEDSTSHSSPRHIRPRPSPASGFSSRGRVLSSSSDGCRIWTELPNPCLLGDRGLIQYYDHTKSDKLIISEVFKLIETPCFESMRGAIHLSGLSNTLECIRIGICDEGGTFDARRSRILSCGLCGTPIFEDHGLYQTLYPTRILALFHEFLYNQRRGMVCHRRQEIHGEFFEIDPRQARYALMLLVQWATLEPYDTAGQLREKWRGKLERLRAKAQDRRQSLDPGKILVYLEVEQLFRSFLMEGEVDTSVWDDEKVQIVKFRQSA